MPRTDLRTAKIRELRNKLNQARAFIFKIGVCAMKDKNDFAEVCAKVLDVTEEREFPRGGTKNC